VLTHYGWPDAADAAAQTLRDTIEVTRHSLRV